MCKVKVPKNSSQCQETLNHRRTRWLTTLGHVGNLCQSHSFRSMTDVLLKRQLKQSMHNTQKPNTATSEIVVPHNTPQIWTHTSENMYHHTAREGTFHVKIVAVLRLRQGHENWEGYVCQTDHTKNSSGGGTARNTDAFWGYQRMVLCKLCPSEQACAKKILYSPSQRDQPTWPPIDECRWRSKKVWKSSSSSRNQRQPQVPSSVRTDNENASNTFSSSFAWKP